MPIALPDIGTRLPDRPFTSTELVELGIPRPWLRARLDAGELRSPFRGVYLPSDLPDTHALRATTVGLVTTRHHVICDRTAAWVHGIDCYAHAELQAIPEIETCARRGHRTTRLRGADGRTRDLADEDIMVVGGLRVTTPLRTSLDLGCNLRRREAMAALNAFARLHGVTAQQLARQLPRFRRRRGVVQLRELIPARHSADRVAARVLGVAGAARPRSADA